MKMINKASFLILPIGLLAMVSCNNNAKTTNQTGADSISNTKIGTTCYQAINGKDSAFLKIAETNGEIGGELSFNFDQKKNANGTIKGEFKGDTLFVDYMFTVDGVASRNPQAFLKKGNQLLQGNGEILTYLGKTYFKKDAEIDFTKGFVFELVDCK